MKEKVIAIDDQPEVLGLLEQVLARDGVELEGFKSGEEALERIREGGSDATMAVLDLDLGPGRLPGMKVLERLRQLAPELPVVILTGKGSIQTAVEAMRIGAADFIEKDPDMAGRLGLQLEKARRLRLVLEDNRRLRVRCAELERRDGEKRMMVGTDGGLKEVWEKIRRLADIPRPVLIVGERGTGKELVASALHRMSNRRDGPFVTINCAAVSESLAEAELFGHAKGAFTDASEAKPGKFELADGGTLFLDEIGNMPPGIQKKILRVIEYQSFTRLRDSKQIKVDVRITAATNADLPAEIEKGRFRADLYDRLSFEVIRVPPLRERMEDLPALCRYFIERFREEVPGIECTGISDEALDVLRGHDFPGNVRELKNLIERAAYRCTGKSISPEDLGLDAEARSPAAGDFHRAVRQYEMQLLRRALNSSGNNMKRAAERLGLS
ncbi:MAG: sigma-54-dependent Fis family transcriptional regulator, partial [Deltaproteobacteria bacterium]